MCVIVNKLSKGFHIVQPARLKRILAKFFLSVFVTILFVGSSKALKKMTTKI